MVCQSLVVPHLGHLFGASLTITSFSTVEFFAGLRFADSPPDSLVGSRVTFDL
jgi:hypothetical protein